MEQRVCAYCGHPLDPLQGEYMETNGEFYYCSYDCFKRDFDKDFGPDNWREATEDEAQEYGAHYMVRDFPGGSWRSIDVFWTDWEDEMTEEDWARYEAKVFAFKVRIGGKNMFDDLIKDIKEAAEVRAEVRQNNIYVENMKRNIMKVNTDIKEAKDRGVSYTRFTVDPRYRTDLTGLYNDKGYTIEEGWIRW